MGESLLSSTSILDPNPSQCSLLIFTRLKNITIVLSKPFEILEAIKPSEWGEFGEGLTLHENKVMLSNEHLEEEDTSQGNSVDQEYDGKEEEMKKWSPEVWKQLDNDLKDHEKRIKAVSNH